MAHEDNEEYQGLGELSEDIFNERGGFPPQAKGTQYVPGQSLPPDIAYQSEVDSSAAGASLGSPSQETFVTSTYNIRPINARDFVIAEKQTMLLDAVGNATPAEVSFLVPNGYVGVLQKFAWSFIDPLPLGDNSIIPPVQNNFLFTAAVYVNETVQPDYDALERLGVWLNRPFPAYVLANALQKITLRITPFADTGITVNSQVLMKIYGNVLLAKGLPLEYEPGSF